MLEHEVKLILILLHQTSPTKGFIAYEYTKPRLNITSFNTLTVKYCEVPNPSKNVEIPRIKLIQKSETQIVIHRVCYVTIDYLITKCLTFEDAQVV